MTLVERLLATIAVICVAIVVLTALFGYEALSLWFTGLAAVAVLAYTLKLIWETSR